MTGNEYQDLSVRTLGDAQDTYAHKGNWQLRDELQTMVLTTKLAGETGEVCELLGKAVGHDVIPDDLHAKLEKEVGDVMWYLAAICKKYGLFMDDAMVGNVKKLKARYPDGFVHGGGLREG